MTSSPSAAPRSRPRGLLALWAAACAALAYVPALRNGFVNFDDDLYVTSNLHIRSLAPPFWSWAFTTFDASNWHPLTWVSHAVDWAIWGATPFGHHLTSVLLHALNSGLVVLLTLRLLDAAAGEVAPESSAREAPARATALATGLLFALHPIHVESVAWVAERKDVLSGAFFLLALVAYSRHARGRGAAPGGGLGRDYLLALVAATLAMLAKPMAVTLPAVMLVLDLHPFDRLRAGLARRAILEKVPFLVLSALVSAATLLAQAHGGALVPAEHLPWPARALVAVRALAGYLGLMLVPRDLVPFYPLSPPALWSPGSIAALVTAGGITVLCVSAWRRQRLWAAAWAVYCVTLLPVLGLVQAGGQAMADRYAYLPSISPLLVAGLGVGWLVARGAPPAAGPSRRIALGGVVAVLAVLAILTFRQIGIWRSSIDLWTAVIERRPGQVALAHYNRAQALLARGALEEAIQDYGQALSIFPRYYDAAHNRAMALQRAGRLDEARASFALAARLDPTSTGTLNEWAILCAQAGDPEQALALFDRAIAITPADVRLHLNRAITLRALGRTEEAARGLGVACSLGSTQACAGLRDGGGDPPGPGGRAGLPGTPPPY